MSMGPEYGTPEYKQQVEMIVAQLKDVEMRPDELPQFLSLYIFDTSIARAAICEAEKKLIALRNTQRTGADA